MRGLNNAFRVLCPFQATVPGYRTIMHTFSDNKLLFTTNCDSLKLWSRTRIWTLHSVMPKFIYLEAAIITCFGVADKNK